MGRALTVEFTKMHGAGNDFIVFDNRWYRFNDEELATLAASWCRRHYSIGADGLLALTEADSDADYRMRYVNADGSWATMCGNGARCLARFASASGLGTGTLTFETDAGRYHAEVREEGGVRLYVPPPSRLTTDIALNHPLPDGLRAAHYVHTGTEHLVVFVKDLDATPVATWGARLRKDDALQPAGANVNFTTVTDDGLRVRTYEKGVEAETLSCGTGVLAAAAVAIAAGRVEEGEVRVDTRGGELVVGMGDPPYLEGPVQAVYRGTIEVE